MANFDLTAAAVAMVCPTNKVVIDDKGLPSIYVRMAPQTLKTLLTAGDDSIHPAFMISNSQKPYLYFGKFQGVAHNNRIYSLPAEDPQVNINLDNFEAYCRNKGPGHHCITAAEWAFLALWCKKNNCQPKGNNQWGRDIGETDAIAIPTATVQDTWNDPTHVGQTARVATGTGPLTWSHDGTISGIWDLNGNVWEWVAGIRLVKGELQVIPYNNAADATVPTNSTSVEWRAINADAERYTDLFIEPDGEGTTKNSVKLDWAGSVWRWGKTIETQADAPHDCEFGKTTMVGLSEFAQMYMRAMALAPDGESTAYNGDRFWANNGAAERCACRGGRWRDGAYAGVFSLSFDSPRSDVPLDIGGRPAFFE